MKNGHSKNNMFSKWRRYENGGGRWRVGRVGWDGKYKKWEGKWKRVGFICAILPYF